MPSRLLPRARRHGVAGLQRGMGMVGGRDDGSVSLELSIVFPVVLLLILTIVQAGLYLFARDEVYSAARVGLDNARTQNNTAAAGVSSAQAYLVSQDSAGLLQHVTVSSNGSTATSVAIHVHADLSSLIPGLPVSIDEVAAGPVETFTSP